LQDKIGAIIGLMIGIFLIIFRKKFPDLLIRKQLGERATPRAEKAKRNLKQLEEIGLKGVLHRTLEIVPIILGVFLILMGISEFFPAHATKYIIGLPVAAFFAAIIAAFFELEFLFPFLWKDVQKYIRDYHGILHQDIQTSSGTDKIKAAMSGPTDDPTLCALQRKAVIYSVICFIPLFLIILFAFHVIYILTS